MPAANGTGQTGCTALTRHPDRFIVGTGGHEGKGCRTALLSRRGRSYGGGRRNVQLAPLTHQPPPLRPLSMPPTRPPWLHPELLCAELCAGHPRVACLGSQPRVVGASMALLHVLHIAPALAGAPETSSAVHWFRCRPPWPCSRVQDQLADGPPHLPSGGRQVLHDPGQHEGTRGGGAARQGRRTVSGFCGTHHLLVTAVQYVV